MEIRTEYHRTQKTLFRRVNQIRKANGTCDFEQEGNGYRLKYCETDDLDHVYIVQNGKDGLPFRLHDGMEGSFFHLCKGEVLVYECESGDKVWFSCPKWLEELGETDLDHHIGYTEYGSLSEMVRTGLIINTRHMDRPLIVTANGEMKEKLSDKISPIRANTEEMLIPAPIENDSLPKDTSDEYYGSFDTIKSTLDLLKNAIGNIGHVNRYTSPEKVDGIRTLKVIESRGPHHAAHIRLAGRWIERAGFKYGDYVQVITMKGMVLVVPVQPPPEIEVV